MSRLILCLFLGLFLAAGGANFAAGRLVHLSPGRGKSQAQYIKIENAQPRGAASRTIEIGAYFALPASAFTSSIASMKRWLISDSASALDCWIRSPSSFMCATAC